MAIATTIIKRTVFGNEKVVMGKSVISGGTDAGEVETSLRQVTSFHMTVQGSTQKGCNVNETFPLKSGTVTAETESNDQTFYWVAYGY